MSASNLSSKLKLELILYARTVARLNYRWECVWLRDVFGLESQPRSNLGSDTKYDVYPHGYTPRVYDQNVSQRVRE